MRLLQRLERNLTEFTSIFAATLREIFEENSYARFLERNGLVVSRDSYAQYLSETAQARERRHRCC